MKKSEFIDLVAEKAETTRTAAARMVDAIFDTSDGAIAAAVRAGNHVSIPGFGKFQTKTRSARKGRNPQTGAEIDIPERTVVSFSPGKGLNEVVSDNSKVKGKARKGGKAAAAGGKAAGGTAKPRKAPGKK
jgi:DNA-binding protein HU-beta